MTILNGWFDFAVREPGPPNRRQRFNNSLDFIVFHSMEGVRGGYNVMYDANRTGIAWHGTIARDGALYQHYPIEAGLYHGGPAANPYAPGFELEGFAGEDITPAQVRIATMIIKDIGEYTNRSYTRENNGVREHGEVAQTACPSHRYDTLWATLGDDMTKDEVLQIIKELRDNGDLASTTDVLSCVAQIVGVEPLSYTDKKKVDEVKQAIAELSPVLTPKARVATIAKDPS